MSQMSAAPLPSVVQPFPSNYVILQWAVTALNATTSFLPASLLRTAPRFPIPNNLTSVAGNTYKNVYEATSMHSGLILIIFVNIITAMLGILFYRYVILREAGLLSPDEVSLLRKYPNLRSPNSYTPSESFVRAAPPMRWTGWRPFFTTSETPLSRDAQVYLLFQRACILMTAVCALISSIFLLPSYWFGGAIFHTGPNTAPPRTLLSLIQSDRGIFERFTSHNLPDQSPLVVLQLPVFVVIVLCVVALYSVITTAAGETRSDDEWLRSGPSASQTVLPSPTDLTNAQSPSTTRQWTVFARGLPRDCNSADNLYDLLEVIFPTQVARVELVCRGKVSEARLLHNLSSARHRLDYLYQTVDDPADSVRLQSQTLIGRIFSLFTPRATRRKMIYDLESKISVLQKEFQSRKAEPVRDFLGCAFISFRSSNAAATALKDFPVRIRHRRLSMREPNDANAINVRHSTSSWLGGHSRTESDFSVPYFSRLYRGTANLLPDSLRNRIITSPTENVLPVFNDAGEAVNSLEISMARKKDIAITRLRHMKAKRAPKSGDIIWKNIGISFLERTVREMVVQVIVFAFLILFTSPVTMLTALKLVFSELALLTDPQMIFGSTGSGAHNESLSLTTAFDAVNEPASFTFFTSLSADSGAAVESLSKDFLSFMPPFLTSNTYLTAAILAYLPVLLLAFVFAIVPSILRLTCAWEGYPTRSALEMSVFRKTSFYYLMNSVVLPSLALNTASEFLAMVYQQSEGGVNVYNALPILQRLFSGDIAYFLCSYLVQLALTGSVFWLMRIPSSVSMMVRRRMALTPLEVAEAKCADIFDYPRHYAYNVTVMSMVLLFGCMAPLIWYFALFYFICKHVVDVYTLRYVHPRTHIDGRLPRLSANFILIWTIVSQLMLAVMFYLQGWVRAGIATALLCVFTAAGCLSVSSSVGNRMLSVVAMLRDAAVERMLRIFGTGYPWAEATGLMTTSGSSSSSQSLMESHESDALLKGSLIRSESTTDMDVVQPLRSTSIVGRSEKNLERSLNSVREELMCSSANLHTNVAISTLSGAAGLNDGDIGGDDLKIEPGGGGYDSDVENDAFLLDMSQVGTPRRGKRYGTCDPGNV